MRIRVGNRPRGPYVLSAQTKADTARVEEQIRAVITSGVLAKARVKVGPTEYAELQRLVEQRAGREVLRLFPVAIRIIRKARTFNLSNVHQYRYGLGRAIFNNTDLGSLETPGGKKFVGATPKWGEVIWKDLSPSWIEYKYASNPPGNRFFQHTGRLVNYLGGRKGDAKSFGGVDTSVTSKATGANARQVKAVLATFKVSIFPEISPNLIPMLSSNAWTSAGDGGLERKFFPGRTAEKLIGPAGVHRPLFVPLIQFWTAFRIPRAVTIGINQWLRSLK